jgi:transposase InsO family protein
MYLGHVITDKGVQPNPDKVKAVTDFPAPRNTKEMKSFLGLVGYYRRFIEGFSKVTKPLTSLLKKDAAFHWSSEQELAFNYLKEKLTTAPLLQYPDFSQTFVVTTDASSTALGAVLSQGPIGKDLPIAYASRTMNKHELNYSVTEKELLAIVFAVKCFRPYLFGNRFLIVTDHRPLTWLFNVKDPGSRLIRWRLKLEEFEYDVVYKPGRLNSNADALSRIPIHVITRSQSRNHNQNLNSPNQDTYEQFIKTQTIKSTERYSTNIEEHSENLLRSKFISIVCPTSLDFDSSMPYLEEILSTLPNQEDLQNTEREPYTVLPFHSDNKTYYFLFTKIHHYDATNNKTIFNLLQSLRDIILQNNPTLADLAVPDFTEPFTNICYTKIYNMISYVFRNTNITIHIYKNKIIYPTPAEIPQILKENHDSTIAGHPGINRMLNRIKASYYWKTMRKDIEHYVKSCKLCQINKPLRKCNKAPMVVTSSSTKPFERLALDIVGTLPEAGSQNFKYILTLQDDLTKFSCAYPQVTATSEEVARNLVHFMALFGIPKMILTDLGTCFTSELFKQITDIFKIKALCSTPYHPQTNGALERSHSTLKEYLKSFVNENHSDWHSYLFTAILCYNTTPHSTTQYTPYELLYGHKPHIPNSLYETSDNLTYNEYVRALRYRMRFSREKALEYILKSKETSKRYYDSPSHVVSYKVGDLVYLKQHHRLRKALSPIWKGPFKIIKVDNKHNVTLCINRRHTKYHVNEIKPAHP